MQKVSKYVFFSDPYFPVFGHSSRIEHNIKVNETEIDNVWKKKSIYNQFNISIRSVFHLTRLVLHIKRQNWKTLMQDLKRKLYLFKFKLSHQCSEKFLYHFASVIIKITEHSEKFLTKRLLKFYMCFDILKNWWCSSISSALILKPL